jgi:pilus assembly protein CpaF
MHYLENAFGKLWPYYNDENVYEIFVDSLDDIYIEKSGKLENVGSLFTDKDEVYELGMELLKESGRQFREGKYNYEFALDEATIVNIVFTPVAFECTKVNITKIPKKKITWEDYRKFGAVDDKGEEIIKDIISKDSSLLVAGSVGSGKTTLLNLLVDTIDPTWRVVTMERKPSLILDRKRTARLQTVNNTSDEMIGLVTVAAAMRPDYGILNELSGPETMDFINSLHDGHSGMALLSADNVFDVIKRLELKAMTSDFSGGIDSIRYAISQAFDYIIFQEKCDDGKRRVTRIAEVLYEDGELTARVCHQYDE